MKNILVTLMLALSFISLSACTKTYGIKNKALVMSAEKFDDDVQKAAESIYVDKEQQKVFADFMKINTRIDVTNVELQGENEATADLTIKSIPKASYKEYQTISGKDWRAKAAASQESKTYLLKLKKVGDAWQIVEQKEKP